MYPLDKCPLAPSDQKWAVFIEKPEPVTKIQTSQNKRAPDIKVKVEDTNVDGDDKGNEDDDDGDDDDDDNDDWSDEKGQAKCVYKHSLKILKFKLYFEDFFPTNDDRGTLVYNCWMAGAKVTGCIVPFLW